MRREGQVGFSQRIRLDWLDYTANAVLAGNGKAEIAAALRERLREVLSVGNNPERGNRDKAVTILTKVWVTVPEEHRALRDEGLDLLRQASTDARMLTHWCMCMVAYPFFGAVAEATGRLLRLQGTAAAVQIQRRLRERLGERETVARAARRILRAFIDWGVLLETGEKGIYRGTPKRVIGDGSFAVWALKANLSTKDCGPQPPLTLLHAPRMFPFEITPPSMAELETNGTFEIIHHGLDQEVLLGLAEATSVQGDSHRRILCARVP